MSVTTQKPGRPPIALIASVVFNLFLVAVIAGHVLRVHTAPPRHGTVLTRALANAEASLSPSDAAAFRAVMQSGAPKFSEQAAQIAQARQALDRQIEANPFDPDETRQALAAWRSAWSRFLDDFSNALVQALAKVSPDGRQKLVEQRREARVGFSAP